MQRIAPDFEKGYCSRIVLYTNMGLHDKAETMFYLAQQIKEECPLCYYNIGNSFFVRENYEQAIRCLEKTKSIEPTYPQINYRIGQAYWAKGDKYQAKKYFLEELRKSPADIDVLLSYSSLLLETDDLQQAKGILQFITELSNNPYAYHYLGELDLHRGNIQKAIQNFQRALKIKPKLEGTNYRLAQCYLQQGQVINAKAHLLNEIKVRPNNPDLLLDLGALLHEVGLTEKAIHCFLGAVELNPIDPRIFHNLSCCNYLIGSIKDGIEMSLYALDKDPTHISSLENLIHVYLYNGEIRKVQNYMKKAIKYWPGHKKLKSLKRGIILSKPAHILKRIFGSHPANTTEIAKKMRKTMYMEHSKIKWYPHEIPNGRRGRFKNLSLLPPLVVRKAEWRK